MQVRHSTARNYSEETENRIHSDEVAERFGFTGALVPGVAVFGHMTYQLVEALGDAWLSGYTAYVRLHKPAYHGDELTTRHSVSGDQHTVFCHARDELLAELRTSPKEQPPGDLLPHGPETTERPEIRWDNVHVDEPFPTWTWQPDAVANAEAAAQIEDDLTCYGTGIVHPHAILSMANRTFTRRYFLPAWLHVSSEIRFHRLLRVGEPVEVRTVPTRKWERKGHEFVDLNIQYLVPGDSGDGAKDVATEIVHTSIFKIAER